MRKLRIYTDTSVIGGCFDPEYRGASRRLIELFKTSRATLVLSELTLLELTRAPLRVRQILDGVPPSNREHLELTDEAGALATAYLQARILGSRQEVDAQHIAIATIAKVDLLVSWNFKHIVNLERIHGYNSVNLRWGYPLLEIRSPLEVAGHEES